MDFPRDARALLGDGPTELREADRTPRADHEHAVRDHTEEVTLRDVVAAQQRREKVVQRGEQHQRCAQAEPAVEVLSLLSKPQAEADDREQVEQRLRREESRENRGQLVTVV